jgi:hypothetical protein
MQDFCGCNCWHSFKYQATTTHGYEFIASKASSLPIDFKVIVTKMHEKAMKMR